MSAEEYLTLKVPVFDGEQANFQSWWIRFQAYSRVKGFNSVLKEHAEMPEKEDDITNGTLDSTNDKDKVKIAVGKRNIIAMAHLTMALGTESLFNKVTSVSSEKWPGGLAHEFISKLKEEYQPVDINATVEMKMKTNGIKMNKNDRPAKLFEQIKGD